jgi:hypothetical protein
MVLDIRGVALRKSRDNDASCPVPVIRRAAMLIDVHGHVTAPDKISHLERPDQAEPGIRFVSPGPFQAMRGESTARLVEWSIPHRRRRSPSVPHREAGHPTARCGSRSSALRSAGRCRTSTPCRSLRAEGKR